MRDDAPEHPDERGVSVWIVPSEIGQVTAEPTLDGSEPRLARPRDGGAHALGTTAERTQRIHGASGSSPLWYGPAATMTSPSLRAVAVRHQVRPRLSVAV